MRESALARMLRSTTPLILVILSTATACSSGSSPMPPGSSDDVFSATVDGETWTGLVEPTTTRYDGTTFNLLGIGRGIEIGLTVNTAHPDAAIPGVLDMTAGAAGGHVNEGDDTWFPVGEGGSGTLTITELGATRARGTFSFVAGPLGGSATGTRSVTNGVFDIAF